MREFLTNAVFGIAVASVLLAMPAVSQAQSWEYRNGDWSYNSGSGNYGYNSYSNGYNSDTTPGYVPNSQRYSIPSYVPNYDSYYSRPVQVHPESIHWTPERGWHTHEHIHVPHQGHYHTRPY